MKKNLIISEEKMTQNSNIPQSEEEITDVIEILTFLNYDGTVNLYGIDPAEAFQ